MIKPIPQKYLDFCDPLVRKNMSLLLSLLDPEHKQKKWNAVELKYNHFQKLKYLHMAYLIRMSLMKRTESLTNFLYC